MEEPNSLINPPKTQPQKKKHNSSTPFSNFIYKAIIACVLIALLPIFPSQSPELEDKTILTRSWEFLHLLLVGIVVSYGLFSRRNSEPDLERETQLKPDTPQSYVSGILHVSSVFNDEEEETIESPRNETKVQTWNYSMYNPIEPVIMVAAKESSNGNNNGATKNPLFLSVRSLKPTDGDGEIGGKEGTVLPSPIPWRSRSGRMEIKEESCFPPPRSSEIRTKISEDMGRKKSFYKPPAPPPPPPLPLGHRYQFGTEKKSGRKSFKAELEDMSMRGKKGFESPKHDNSTYVRTVRSQSRKQRKKRNEFREKMIIESDGSDSDDDSQRSSGVEEEEVSNCAPEENEVDKKADEFIAKFREQIRLQRIEAIKRSTEQKSVRNQN